MKNRDKKFKSTQSSSKLKTCDQPEVQEIKTEQFSPNSDSSFSIKVLDGNSDNLHYMSTVLQNNNPGTSGNYYMVLPNQTVPETSSQSVILPKSQIIHLINPDANQVKSKSTKDEKKRANHNEIERRRRDKIASWILKLGKMPPSSNIRKNESKGEILARVCEYISELQATNNQLSHQTAHFQSLKQELKQLQQSVSEGIKENISLKKDLSQFGIHFEEYYEPEESKHNPLDEPPEKFSMSYNENKISSLDQIELLETDSCPRHFVAE